MISGGGGLTHIGEGMIKNRNMLTKVLYKAVLMFSACCWLAACSQDDGISTGHDGNGTGVRLRFSVTENEPTSRATENGWEDDWHENTITRLDLYQFEGDGKLKQHYKPTLTDHQFNFDADNDKYYEMEVEDLTYQDLAKSSTGYTFYLVANCPQLEDASISTLSDLKAVMITPKLDVYGKQSSFVMDAKTTSEDKDLYVVDETNKQITLNFQLYRAAAKIRLAVKSADGDGKDILTECEYQLYHAVADGTSVLAESEKYGRETGQGLWPEEEMRSFQTVYDNTVKGIQQAVFYSYPNDWFNESLLNEDGVFKNDQIYAKDNLVDGDRQTCIKLKAPYYKDGKLVDYYYYKVPVNYVIDETNDTGEKFSKEDIEQLRSDHYRLNRNNIYDITVTIDRAGGPITDPVTPMFYVRINDWEKGGDYHITEGEFN